jgi:enoyl-CoA hydratase/carnithine racemase
VSSDTVIIERVGRIAILTLNRPAQLNAINRETIRRTQVVMDELEADDEIAVVIIRGAGRAFSSGMDLKDDAAAGISGVDAWRTVLEEDLAFLMRFWDFPKPTIAVVHGFCLAAACELAMCCDITIAEEGTYFGEPELKFGSVITAMMMPWLTGPKIAKELLLGADDRVTAERALEIGLINRVVPEGGGMTAAREMAARMAVMDAAAVRLTKRAINRTFETMGLKQALRANLDLAVEIEAMETPSRKRFKEIAKAEGLKAALAWRENRLKGGNG